VRARGVGDKVKKVARGDWRIMVVHGGRLGWYLDVLA
jgi:hypothetical protein